MLTSPPTPPATDHTQHMVSSSTPPIFDAYISVIQYYFRRVKTILSSTQGDSNTCLSSTHRLQRITILNAEWLKRMVQAHFLPRQNYLSFNAGSYFSSLTSVNQPQRMDLATLSQNFTFQKFLLSLTTTSPFETHGRTPTLGNANQCLHLLQLFLGLAWVICFPYLFLASAATPSDI